MKKNYTVTIMALLMIFLFLGQNAHSQSIPITTFNSPYSQDFNTLVSTGTSTVYPTGWQSLETGTNANTTYTAGTGSSNAGDSYSFGAAGNSERALGGLQSGSLIPTIVANFTNNTSGVINSISISYTGEQWRLGTLNRPDRLDFQYSTNATSINTGTWVDVDALDFIAPITTGTVGLLNGNTNSLNISAIISSLNIASGSSIWIRWNDFNATSSDDGLGIDNFSISADGMANPIPLISINDVSLLEGNSGTSNANFTVSLNSPAPVGGVSFDIATASNSATQGVDFVGKSLLAQTIPEGQSTYSFSVEVNGDTDAEPNETFFINITNVTGANVLDSQAQGTIQNDDVSITKIHEIQGSGATSPLVGQQATIKGIVTRTFLGTTSLNGFYMQEEDADTDGNSATSEGIFVFNPSISVSAGDLVQVTGTVIDFVSGASSLTEISPVSAIAVVSSGNPLPSITNISLPVANITDLEKYEGMLVNMSALSGDLVVTENFELGRFGQIVLAANDPATNQAGTDARLDQYTQFSAPSTDGYAAYIAAIAKRTIYLDDARTSQNPDPVTFGRGGNPLSATNTLRTGDAVGSVNAILDQRFEGYRLQPVEPVNFTPANPRPGSNPDVGAATLKVGHMNVLNYFNGNGAGGGFPTSRGADTPAEFSRQRPKILNAILNSGADIMSLNEVENDGYGSTSAIQDIVNGLNDIAGAGTWAAIAPTTPLASDEITVGFIYKPGKATPIGAAKTYLAGEFAAVGRGALAQTFEQNSNGAEFTAVTVHMKSKGSLTLTGSGNMDIGDGQGNNNGQRTRQAEELRDWLSNPATGITDTDILILGDLNSYAKEDPITTLESAGYGTLIPINKYSYQFDGNFGALDHALGTNSIASQTTGAIKWNINSDEPIILDYNVEFKNAGQQTLFYASDEFRSSDHDPVIVGLDLQCEKPTASISSNSENLTVCETETLVLTGSGGVIYSWNDGNFVEENTFSPTETGPVKLIVKDGFGCASEPVTIDVVITPITFNITTVTSCDTYTWANNEQTYTESGTYTGTTTNCVTEKLVLTITPSTENITTVSVCDSYTWANNEQTYTESGTYTGTTTNCITEKLVLTITPSTVNTTTVSVCDTYTWANNGQTYTQSGTYTGTTTNCITEKLVLTITPSTVNTTTVSVCDTYTWANNGQTYTESGTYSGTTTNCVTEKLVLTITPSTENITTVSVCDTYTWANNEQTYTESGTYTGTTTNCITEKLVLTITPSTENITTVSACDSYTWSNNEQTYTESGTYTGTTTNCVTEKLVLTITPSTVNTRTVSVCDSYTWANNEQTYTESGTYTGTTTNCITEKLVLTITPSTVNTTTVSVCDTYTWANNGQTYTQSGTYTGTTTNCVTEKLALTITPIITTTSTITACNSYTWPANGQTYTTSGTYNFVGNCSNQTVVLTINSAGVINGQAIMCKGSKFKFTSSILGGVWTSSNNSIVDIINNSLENGLVKALNYGTATISYTVNGCTSTFEVTVGDIIPPTIICPGPYTKAVNDNKNNCETKVNVAAPIVSDNCGNVVVTYSLSGATAGTGSGKIGNATFNIGVTTVTYTATDEAGNSTTCTTTVTVTNPNCSIGGRISAESLVNDSQENSELSLSIRNNPSYEDFKIMVNSSKNSLVKMIIYGMDGKLFEIEEVTPNTEIKVGQKLNSGIYILRVQQEKLYKTIKIIKE
jgi:predicted extracellular nuclease